MPELIEVTSPSGKTELQTPLNARDLVTHRGWTVGGTKKNKQDFREGESAADEQIDTLGNRRVKDNRRVVAETGVSETAVIDQTLLDGEDAAEGLDKTDAGDVFLDEDEDDEGLQTDTSRPTGNGIVRSSNDELVDDALVDEVKGLNKNQLLAYAKKNYGLDLDGRKNEESLRLAIYDAEAGKTND